jgi:hypothetical protein
MSSFPCATVLLDYCTEVRETPFTHGMDFSIRRYNIGAVVILFGELRIFLWNRLK